MPSLERKSLADRIRAQRPVSSSEREREKELLALVTNQQVSQNNPNKHLNDNDSETGLSDKNTTAKDDNLTSQQLDNLTTRQLFRQLSKQLSKQLDNLTSEQIDRQLDNLTSEQVDRQLDNITTKQPDNLTSKQVDPSPHALNAKQYLVLKHIYFNRPFKVDGPNGLESILKIKYGTIRYSLRSLEKKGLIEKPFPVNTGIYKGSTCRVNSEICFSLFGPTNIKQPAPNINHNEQLDNLTRKQLDRLTTQQLDRQHDKLTSKQFNKQEGPLNSSSSFLKNTTTEAPLDLSDPYLMFWVEKGLTSKKIQLWMNEFNLSSSLLLDFLKWAKFDLVDNDKAKSVKQDDFQAWFYGALKKGGYSKPANYKSHHQILIEQETQELERMKTELKTLNEIRKEKRRLTLEIEFERMMADPEGDLYKRCFELFPSIQKTRYRNPSKQVGPSFEKEMKWSLEKIMHGDLNGTDTDSDQ